MTAGKVYLEGMRVGDSYGWCIAIVITFIRLGGAKRREEGRKVLKSSYGVSRKGGISWPLQTPCQLFH